MTFRVTMKDPDVLHDAINDALRGVLGQSGLDDEEREAVLEIRREAIGATCSKWFKYSEYLTVEIDTEAMTCVVVECGT